MTLKDEMAEKENQMLKRLVNFAEALPVVRKLTASQLVSILSARPITETLPLVKQWLAGEGVGMFEAEVNTLKSGKVFCSGNCTAKESIYGDDETVNRCSLGMGNRDTIVTKTLFGPVRYHDCVPDPSKCPAMLKLKKEISNG